VEVSARRQFPFHTTRYHWIQFRHGFENDAVIGLKNSKRRRIAGVLAQAAAKRIMPNDYFQEASYTPSRIREIPPVTHWCCSCC